MEYYTKFNCGNVIISDNNDFVIIGCGRCNDNSAGKSNVGAIYVFAGFAPSSSPTNSPSQQPTNGM